MVKLKKEDMSDLKTKLKNLFILVRNAHTMDKKYENIEIKFIGADYYEIVIKNNEEEIKRNLYFSQSYENSQGGEICEIIKVERHFIDFCRKLGYQPSLNTRLYYKNNLIQDGAYNNKINENSSFYHLVNFEWLESLEELVKQYNKRIFSWKKMLSGFFIYPNKETFEIVQGNRLVRTIKYKLRFGHLEESFTEQEKSDINNLHEIFNKELELKILDQLLNSLK